MKKELSKKRALGGIGIALVLLLISMYLPVTVKAQMVALFGRFIGNLIRSVLIIGTLLLIYLVIKNRDKKDE